MTKVRAREQRARVRHVVAVAQLALAARRQAVALAAGATRVALQARAARGGERAVERGAAPAQPRGALEPRRRGIDGEASPTTSWKSLAAS